MRKKQEPSPVERRGRRSAFADVVLSDANTNDAGKSSGIELLYPNGVRILFFFICCCVSLNVNAQWRKEYIPEEGEVLEFGINVHRRSYRNESYIRWRKAE